MGWGREWDGRDRILDLQGPSPGIVPRYPPNTPETPLFWNNAGESNSSSRTSEKLFVTAAKVLALHI